MIATAVITDETFYAKVLNLNVLFKGALHWCTRVCVCVCLCIFFIHFFKCRFSETRLKGRNADWRDCATLGNVSPCHVKSLVFSRPRHGSCGKAAAAQWLGISSAGVPRRFQNIPIIPASGGRRAGRSHGIWLKGAPDLSSPSPLRLSLSPPQLLLCIPTLCLSLSLSLSSSLVPLAASLVFTPKCPMLHLSTRTYSLSLRARTPPPLCKGAPPPPLPSASHNGAALKSIPHFFCLPIMCAPARTFVSGLLFDISFNRFSG